MLFDGTWCLLHALGDHPGSSTKSLQEGHGGGAGAVCVDKGVTSTFGGSSGGNDTHRYISPETTEESHPFLVHSASLTFLHSTSPTNTRGGALDSETTTAPDNNSIMVGNKSNNDTSGRRNNASILPITQRQLYRPSHTNSGGGAHGDDHDDTPFSPQPPSPRYADRWKVKQQLQKQHQQLTITPHRLHQTRSITLQPSSKINNNNNKIHKNSNDPGVSPSPPTTPLAAERRNSRLMRRSALNRHGRSGAGTEGGPPVMVTMTTLSNSNINSLTTQHHQQPQQQQQQQQQRIPAAPARLHIQSQIQQQPEDDENQPQHYHHINVDDDDTDENDDEDEQLVCDYDTSATVLYELLESSNWEEARNRCRTHPQEVRTWIVRKDKSLKVRWRLLPLHAAIIFQCPNFIVAALLDKYPAAISSVDDQGMLPLHLAFRHKHEDEDLLELLLIHYPKAVLVKDKRGRVPLEHGRDCKFSAKFTRLYADALIAGSRRAQNKEGVYSSPYGGAGGDQGTAKTTLNTSFRNMEHSPAAASGGVGGGGGAEQEEAAFQQRTNQWRIQQQRQHDAELRRIREQYEGQIKQLQEQHKQEAHEHAVVTKDERHCLLEEHKQELSDVRTKLAQQHYEERTKLSQQHFEEIAELRAIISAQNGRENAMIRDLQTQIGEYQRLLELSQRERDAIALQNERLEVFHSQVKHQMYDIVQDQILIRDLVLQQERDLEAARQMRSQIVRTLMQQEDSDGQNDRATTEKVMEMGETVRGRIQTLLDNDPTSGSKTKALLLTSKNDSPLLPLPAPQQQPKSTIPTKKPTTTALAATDVAVHPPHPPPPPPPQAVVQKQSKLQRHASSKLPQHQQQLVRGPSRVEMERSNGSDTETGVDVFDRTRLDRNDDRKLFHHQHHHSGNNNNNLHGSDNLFESGDEQQETRQDLNDTTDAVGNDDDDDDDALREVKSLGDDISAITEVSP
jgi:Ankyrin repeats (many copies)